MIKYGTTRTVLLIGQWALKFPTCVEWRLFLLGLLANIQETKFWTTRHPKLCPILFALPGGFLIVMRRASPIPREKWEAMNIDIWKNCGDWTIPVEDKLDSFGIIDGQIVAVDYGS